MNQAPTNQIEIIPATDPLRTAMRILTSPYEVFQNWVGTNFIMTSYSIFQLPFPMSSGHS